MNGVHVVFSALSILVRHNLELSKFFKSSFKFILGSLLVQGICRHRKSRQLLKLPYM